MKYSIGRIYYDTAKEEAFLEYNDNLMNQDWVMIADCMKDIMFIAEAKYKDHLKNGDRGFVKCVEKTTDQKK